MTVALQCGWLCMTVISPKRRERLLSLPATKALVRSCIWPFGRDWTRLFGGRGGRTWMPTADQQEIQHLKTVLRELLGNIDCLDDVIFTKDSEPYKAEAVWADALDRAREAAK